MVRTTDKKLQCTCHTAACNALENLLPWLSIHALCGPTTSISKCPPPGSNDHPVWWWVPLGGNLVLDNEYRSRVFFLRIPDCGVIFSKRLLAVFMEEVKDCSVLAAKLALKSYPIAYCSKRVLFFSFATTNNRPSAYVGKYRPPKIQILLTKCDLVKRIDLARRVAFVRQQLEEVMRARVASTRYLVRENVYRNGRSARGSCENVVVTAVCSSWANKFVRPPAWASVWPQNRGSLIVWSSALLFRRRPYSLTTPALRQQTKGLLLLRT